ncbi:MAG: beta-lactamase family protein [Candidatus Aminicenantes bacterium]|nr:beta-lactamase family protein [Candidatus Aminicenantes bacterium]
MKTRNMIVLFVLAAAGMSAASCDSRAALTRKRIKGVEKGLLHAYYFKSRKPQPLNLQDRMAFYRVPAVSIAVVDGLRLEWARAYGTKTAGAVDPATPETLFQAGALSQPPAAAAALRLVEQWRLGLDADVNAVLRRWRVPGTGPAARIPVTLGGLLSHSAGFGDLVLAGTPRGKFGPDLLQVLNGEPPAVNPALRPVIEPGTRDIPAESGFAVLEELLVEAGGKPFPSLMKETVLDPAGMTLSSYESPLPEEWRRRAASGHLRDGRMIEGGWLDYPARAAKGLWTTPSDLAVFGIAVMEAAMEKPSRLLGATAARAMLTPKVGVHGLGFVVEGRTRDKLLISLEGRTNGFSSMLVMIPDKGQAAVVMANGESGEFLIVEILRALSAAYEWPYFKPEEKPLYRLDPAVIRDYLGRYRVTPEYILEVAAEDPCLVITPTGQAPTKFYVDSQAVFFSIDPPARVRFQRDAAGRVDRLILVQGRSIQEALRID